MNFSHSPLRKKVVIKNNFLVFPGIPIDKMYKLSYSEPSGFCPVRLHFSTKVIEKKFKKNK